MRRGIILLLFACGAAAQDGSSPAGRWISNLKDFQENNYKRLELSLNGNKLAGKLGDNDFDGVFESGRIEGTVKRSPQQTLKFAGMLRGDRIEGTVTSSKRKSI